MQKTKWKIKEEIELAIRTAHSPTLLSNKNLESCPDWWTAFTTWTPDLFMEGYNLKKLNKPMKSPSITLMSLIITGREWLKHYPASLFKRSSCAHCIAQLQLEVEVPIMIHDHTRMVSGGRRVLATNSNACCCWIEMRPSAMNVNELWPAHREAVV